MTDEPEVLRAEIERLTAERDAVTKVAGMAIAKVAELTEAQNKAESDAIALAEAAQRDMRERAAALCEEKIHASHTVSSGGGPIPADAFEKAARRCDHCATLRYVAPLIRALPIATPTLDALEEAAMRRALEWAAEHPAPYRRDLVPLNTWLHAGLAALLKEAEPPLCLSCGKHKEKCDGC